MPGHSALTSRHVVEVCTADFELITHRPPPTNTWDDKFYLQPLFTQRPGACWAIILCTEIHLSLKTLI